MGKIIRKAAAIVVCILASLALGACDVNEMSTLREFSNPYLGEYECTQAMLGGKDMLKMFKHVLLTLEKDGTFTISAKSKAGIRSEKSGKYEYDDETEELIFRAQRKGKTHEKRVKLQNGMFTLTQSLSGRELILTFRAKT